jgi:bifunctional DNA-binding transcriptional regulator/antitoxin component of YhaV-PrlF toxin-antitoxin module
MGQMLHGRGDRQLQGSSRFALYAGGMSSTGDLRVSVRGQMSLPASARRRWGLDQGGDVAYLDLGDALVIVPGGAASIRRDLLAAVTPDDWAAARAGFGDADLASE